MRHLTWNGMELFRSPKRAAQHCVRHDLNPYDLQVLIEGRLEPADDHEIDDLILYWIEAEEQSTLNRDRKTTAKQADASS